MRCASRITIRSGFITSRIEVCSRSRRIAFIAIRFWTRCWTSLNTSSLGSGTSMKVRAKRPRRRDQPPLPGQDLVEPPAGDVGEREQPQGLAGRRAVDDHDVEVAGLVVALDLQQAEELVHARRHGQLLGGDAHHAAVGEQPGEPVLDGGPVRLHLALRLDLLRPEQVVDLGRVGAEGRLEGVGEAVRRVGRKDDRSQPGRRTTAGGGSGDAGLADAPLARVENRARWLPRPGFMRVRHRGSVVDPDPPGARGRDRPAPRTRRTGEEPSLPSAAR